MPRFLTSFRFSLILVSILALLPILGLVLYKGAQLREQAVAAAEADLLWLAHLAASNQDTLIEGARQKLVILSLVPVVQDTQTGDCDAYLAELLSHNPSYSNFVVAMPNGDVVCSGLPRPEPVNLADRAYFQRILQTRDLAVSDYLIAKGPIQRAIITVAYPILDDARQIKRILVVGLKLDWMNKIAELTQLPPGSSLAVIDSNGTILTRYPDHEKYVGKTFDEAPIVKIILESKTEGTIQALGLDGINRVYTFYPLGNPSQPNAFIFIGIPSAVVFADADRLTGTLLTGLFVATALSLAVMWFGSDVFLLRRMRTLINTVKLVGMGDLSARTSLKHDLGELGELARSFDEMAVALQQREDERKQAEEALRTSEERFRTWFEYSSDVVTIIELDGTIQYESPSIEHSLGYKPEELIGTNAFDLIHPDDRERVMETFAQNIQTLQNAADAEFRLRHRDGSWRVFEGLGKSFLDEHGQLAGLINSRDITNRKQAEEALSVSKIRYRALFEQSHFAVFILDLEGRHLEANRRAADMLGYTFEELIKISVNETSADLVESNKTLKRLIAGEHIPLYERFFQKKSGEMFPVEIHLELVRNNEGRPLHIQSVVRDITAQKQAEERIQTQLQNLSALRAIDTALLGSIDLQYTLNVVVQQTAVQLGVDAVAVLLLNPHSQTLTYAAGTGFRSQAIERSCERLGEGHAGRAALTQHVVSVHNFRETETDFVRAELLVEEDFTCHHAVPLIAKGKVNGVLEVFVRSHRETSEDWAEFLETLAGQAAIAIDYTNLFSDLQHANVDLALAYDTTIEGWSNALDLRDKETEGHSQRVTEITMKLARATGITEEELVHVRRGALLHDIGKMGIPDHILLKPDKLTDEEWVVMRKHPTFAFELLSPIEHLHPALDIPYCHHEKWDGSGYPRGLKGEQIPLAARLFAIADVWDALLSDRPYRQSWSKEKVIEHIKSLSGTHFDPKVAELFLNLMINDEKDAG